MFSRSFSNSMVDLKAVTQCKKAIQQSTYSIPKDCITSYNKIQNNSNNYENNNSNGNINININNNNISDLKTHSSLSNLSCLYTSSYNLYYNQTLRYGKSTNNKHTNNSTYTNNNKNNNNNNNNDIIYSIPNSPYLNPISPKLVNKSNYSLSRNNSTVSLLSLGDK